MKKSISFFNSTVGKKILIGLTGLFLFIFLIVHLSGNLLLLIDDNGKTFNEYSELMASPKNIIVRIFEWVLFIALIYHIISTLVMTYQNKVSRKMSYKLNRPSHNSTFASRTMAWSGIIILIFLVVHLNAFFVPHRFGHPSLTLYDSVKLAFENNIYYTGFYVFCMIILIFHISHGFQSALQTLGFYHQSMTPVVKKMGLIVSLLIGIGFALIPLYFF